MGTQDDRVLIGTRKGLIEARKRANGWALSHPALKGLPVPYAVRDARNGSIWASLDHGHWGVKLARSKNDGGDYDEVEAPKYPKATGKTAKYYWVLQPGHAEAPDTFWIGTEPGGLFQSTDDGTSWALNQPLWDMCARDEWTGGGRDQAGIHSICIDPRDAEHMVIGVSCAGTTVTRDGGATWAYCNNGVSKVFEPEDADADFGHDPHFVTMAPSNPDVLWQANHCGVFRTTDGGAKWADLSQKPLVYFGFPVAVHPAKPETAWLVPMQSDQHRMTVGGKLVVMRTDDGGESWVRQTEGLPQENAWDFPFRHAFDVAPSGDTLVFGTTSGNLYVSENGGESWDTLSNNLPPIYSTRFA